MDIKTIGFYGNTCNFMFQICKVLRKISALDAHLFLDIRHDFQMLPESDSPELVDNYPSWIHKEDYIGNMQIIFPSTSSLIAELNQFDLVILSFNGLMIAPYLDKKTVFFVTGGDLTIFPFPMKSLHFYDSIAKKIGAIYRGKRQVEGIRCVDQIWSQPFLPFKLAENRLNVNHKVQPFYFPLIIDTEEFTPIKKVGSSEVESQIKLIKDKFDRYIFSPARIRIDDDGFMVETGQWKNNIFFLNVLKKYIGRTGDLNTAILLIDKQGSAENEEQKKFKSIIKSLGLSDFIVWLTPPSSGGYTRNELARFYQESFAVADDFGVGWFGSIALEGLSSGKPVFNFLDEKAMAELYPWHPILSSRDIDEVSVKLEELIRDNHHYQLTCEKSRTWINDFHSASKAGDVYLRNLGHD